MWPDSGLIADLLTYSRFIFYRVPRCVPWRLLHCGIWRGLRAPVPYERGGRPSHDVRPWASTAGPPAQARHGV